MNKTKRKYDYKLIEALQKNQFFTTYEGVKVSVKPIPEGGKDGEMDPRLYRQIRFMPLLLKLMGKPRKKPKSPYEAIVPIRKMFGKYKGRYISNEGIKTHYLTVESSDKYPIPVRVYTSTNSKKDVPIFVYFHGGGFFGGGADIVEQMCKTLVKNCDCIVLNVEYRLSPEVGYPIPFDDCFYSIKWIFNNAITYGGDKNKLIVSGDSAGGNLAAAVALRDKIENNNMVKAQVLLYPLTLMTQEHNEYYKGVDISKYHASKKTLRIVSALSKMMNGLTGSLGLDEIYLQKKIFSDDIYASPALADPKMIVPTLLIFGEFDFLVFDNFAYAKKLTANNIPLDVIVYRGMSHGFADQIGVAPQAEDCMLEIAKYIKDFFKSSNE